MVVVALAGLTFLTACGSQGETPTDQIAVQLPVAETRTVDAPPTAEGPGGLAGVPSASGQAASGQKVEKPVVAKTQKWVKIFSGPSDKDIKPNEDKTKGTNTVELNATENAQIGTYVTDGAGRTLYRFDNDNAKPPKSTCNGECATAWPPLLIKSPGKIFPNGIDPKIIGYVERADGHCQVTINGWPVYYFVGDEKAGDINGQGVNDKWFAIAPTGGKTRPIPGFPLTSPTPGK
jgi:predicted lipoprotein with Yx(FWY)xxD motif